jgi:hypothetical protein
MRASLRFSVCVVAAAVLGCQGNKPISPSSVAMHGAAGTMGAAGASGSGPVGAAGASAGASGTGTGGAAGAPLMGEGGSGVAGDGAATCGSPRRVNGSCVNGAYRRPDTGDCECQSGTTCVCGSTCVDPLNDDDNCGACGHRCGPTSTCTQGVCGPPVVNVLPAQNGCGMIELGVSGDTLYWTELGHGSVRSMPVAGGAITTISSNEISPADITAVRNHVFWTMFGSTIRHAVDKMIVKDVVGPTNGIHGFAVSPDTRTVYFDADARVWRVPATGGVTPTLVASDERGGVLRALTLNGDKLAYINDFTADVDLVTLVDGQVVSCGNEDADGRPIDVNCARLARSQGQLLSDVLLSTPTAVFFVDGGSVKRHGTEQPGGPFDLVATTASQDPISGFALSDTLVYFAQSGSQSSDGVIYKAPSTPNLDNTPAIRIARGQQRPISLAVGANKVYWSTANCTIESQDL